MKRKPAYLIRGGHVGGKPAEVVALLRVALRATTLLDQRERLIRYACVMMRELPHIRWQWELGEELWHIVDDYTRKAAVLSTFDYLIAEHTQDTTICRHLVAVRKLIFTVVSPHELEAVLAQHDDAQHDDAQHDGVQRQPQRITQCIHGTPLNEPCAICRSGR